MGQEKKEFRIGKLCVKVSPLQNLCSLWLLEHMIWDYLSLWMHLGEPEFTWEHAVNIL